MSSALFDRLDAMQSWVHRRRWCIRLATAAILIPLLWPFVSSRWNAQPAKPLPANPLGIPAAILDLGLIAPPPEVDNTAALAKTLLALPPDPPLAAPASAPEGHEWIWWDEWRKRQGAEVSVPQRRPQPGNAFFDISEAYLGEWMPQRHHLKEIINYLELPATQAALDDLVSMAGKPHCLTEASIPGCLSVFRRGIRTLTARARYELAEHQDFEAAVRDIEAVLRLSDGMADDGNLLRLLVAMACRSLALEEIQYWPEEFSLTSIQLERLVRLLNEHPFDGRTSWKQAMHGEMRLARTLLDAIYARTPDGNGFQVLADAQAAEPRSWALGALNLLSPLFEDLRGAESLVVRLDEQIDGLSELPLQELRRLGDAATIEFRPVLGAAWQYKLCLPSNLAGTSLRSLVLGLVTQVRGDLSATVIALERYRLDQGHYPAQLSLLAPKYVPETPMDLFADSPLRYRLDEINGYLLYSVGEDEQDNDGRISVDPDDGSRDHVAVGQRGEPYAEWVLVPQESGGRRE